MTLSFGGGAGVLTIPDLFSDGLTPGGIFVTGAIDAGHYISPNANPVNRLSGLTLIFDTAGNIAEGDNVLGVNQSQGLSADFAESALQVRRSGALNGFQYTGPVLLVIDHSGSTADLQQWTNSTGQAAAIGQAGGLGLFGHAAPTAPRTLAQATITAITDANAKAAVQACANALADMGVLTLT